MVVQCQNIRCAVPEHKVCSARVQSHGTSLCTAVKCQCTVVQCSALLCSAGIHSQSMWLCDSRICSCVSVQHTVSSAKVHKYVMPQYTGTGGQWSDNSLSTDLYCWQTTHFLKTAAMTREPNEQRVHACVVFCVHVLMHACRHCAYYIVIACISLPPVDTVCENLQWRQEMQINMNRNKVDETPLICVT